MIDTKNYSQFIALIRAGGFDIEMIRDDEPVWKGDAPDDAFLAGVQLEIAKAEALSVARETASRYRRQIAEHVPEERAIAWVLKAAFGSAWALHEQNPTLTDSELATAAQAGFAAEAAITGEDAKDLRDRALSKSVLFFQATQVVEGMERLAEARIPVAATPEELETTIAELRAQEEAAAAKLATLT